MNHIDLFCGGGGSSAGLHLAGFNSIFAIDIEDYCIQTYNLNFGNIGHVKDINELRTEEILDFIGQQQIDLITASPPCEPFTAANEKRIVNPFDRLFSDPFGRLMIRTIEIIADLNPKFYIIENVIGVLAGDGKKLLSDHIQSLGLPKPFFNVIDATAWGLPSERVRVLISNVRFESPRTKQKNLGEILRELPEPDLPDEFTIHTTTALNSNQEKQIPVTLPGDALVFFRGANKDYRNYIRLYNNKPAPVVMGKSRFIHPTEDRLLTPFEHARLMSFPKNFIYSGSREQIYDMIGEAVPPLIMKHIGLQIKNQSAIDNSDNTIRPVNSAIVSNR